MHLGPHNATAPALGAAATIVALLIAMTPATSAGAASTKAASKCTKAKIAGKHTCLSAGQSCNHRYEKQYVQYGFSCIKKSHNRWRLTPNKLTF